MAISSKYIMHQGSTLSALGKTAFSAIKQSIVGVPKTSPTVPGEEFCETLKPRSKELISDYVKHVGGSPVDYEDTLPAHLFAQWSFGISGQTIKDVPYPLAKILNGGCRLEIHAPIPNDQELLVRARLESIDDNGRRAVLHQKITTGTAEQPNALVASLYAIVPLKRKKTENSEPDTTPKPKKEKAKVPEDVREIELWELPQNAGLDFAKLTGDFNPIHWVRPYAKMFGHRSVILHGFSTLARSIESLHKNMYGGVPSIKMIDVQFTRPLVLPAKVGLYTTEDQHVYVGDKPGGTAYMIGTFSTEL